MSESKLPVGAIGLVDLTVGPGDEVRDFCREVAGCTASPVDMGGYSDDVMSEPASGNAVAGVCHARGVNAELPPQWLIYITVTDSNESVRRCAARGGTVVAEPKQMGGYGRVAVIRNPAGAVAALFEPKG